MITSLPLSRVIELHAPPEPDPPRFYWAAPAALALLFLQILFF